MTDKELLIKLNKLRTIQADADFKSANRHLLLAQITQGEEVKSLGVLAQFNIFFSRLFQPYTVAVMIVLFFVASGVSGWQLSQTAKPGDSLYLAKKLSERAKMMVAVNDQAKTKLNLEFANNRLAEMSLLQQVDNKTDNAPTEGLKNDFKKEISQVKDRLAKTANEKTPSSKTDDFASAGVAKDGTHVDVAVPVKPVASSTNDAKGLGEVLEEAQQLFDNGAYDQAATKLDQANQLIDQIK